MSVHIYGNRNRIQIQRANMSTEKSGHGENTGCRDSSSRGDNSGRRESSGSYVDRPSGASGPNLIDVIIGTFPDLYLIGVGKVAVCEIEAETLKTMSNPVRGRANAIPYLDWSERFYHRQCKTSPELEGYRNTARFSFQRHLQGSNQHRDRNLSH